jgi:hypothetical protein
MIESECQDARSTDTLILLVIQKNIKNNDKDKRLNCVSIIAVELMINDRGDQ